MKRFDMIPQHCGAMTGDSKMEERSDGDWVKFQDVDGLCAELATLRAATTQDHGAAIEAAHKACDGMAVREDQHGHILTLEERIQVGRMMIRDYEKWMKQADESAKNTLPDTARLNALFDLTNIESKTGDWRVTLEYNNYQDVAEIRNGDGKIIGQSLLMDGIDDEEEIIRAQFRAAIDSVTNSQQKCPDCGGEGRAMQPASAPKPRTLEKGS